MSTCDFCQSKQLNFLSSMSPSERDRVKQETETIHVSKGVVVFFEEDVLQRLFYIQEGVCKFSRLDDKGNEQIIKLLGKGELMGRRSVISNKGALVTATAITDTKLCSIDKKPIVQCLKKNVGFCMDVLNGFIADTKADMQALDIICNHKSIKQRLAGLLCYLKDNFGTEKDGSLTVRLKREEMASIIGTSSEYVINILKHFKEDGLISTEKGKLKVLSGEGLLKIV